MSSCPSLATLALLDFESPPPEALQGHVDSCRRCQQRLDELLAHERAAGSLLLPPCEDPPEIPGFTIEKELGRGGMSVVYQAYQQSLDRRVAIKVVGSGPAAGTRSRGRWIREARAFTRITHEHVVRLHQVGESAGWLYLVLELVPGGSLESRLEQPLEPREAADLVRRLSSAVAEFHSRRLLHLDLKPSNILINAGPDWVATVKVSDFGIAHLFSGDSEGDPFHSMSAGPLGTPAYMSPEQTTGDVVQFDPAPDVYGLGAILYHALTGRPPHEAPSIAETLEQVRTKAPAPPRSLRSAIPRDLETICLKCLEKDPRERYPTAKMLGEELTRWLEGKPILARPVGAPERAWIACRRRPLLSALAGTLAATLLVSLGAITVLWRNAESARRHAERANERSLVEYQLARSALADLVDLGILNVQDRDVEPAEVVERLEKVRHRTRAAVERNGSDPELRRLVALIDHCLANELHSQGRTAAALPIFKEALACWDLFLSRSPGDPAALRDRWRLLYDMGVVHGALHGQGDAASFWEEALRVGESVADRDEPAWSFRMGHCCFQFASSLEALGRIDQAREAVRRGLTMIASDPGARGSPLFVAWRLVLEFQLEYLGERAAREPDQRRLPALIATSPAFRELDGAQRLACLDELVSGLAAEASLKRRLKKTDQVAMIVDDIRLIAVTALESHPDNAISHWLMSRAALQQSKAGYVSGDFAGIERHLRRSIAEAEHALRLDPGHKDVAEAILSYRERLRKLQEGLATRLSAATGAMP